MKVPALLPIMRMVGGIAVAAICVGSLAIAGFVLTERSRDHESG